MDAQHVEPAVDEAVADRGDDDVADAAVRHRRGPAPAEFCSLVFLLPYRPVAQYLRIGNAVIARRPFRAHATVEQVAADRCGYPITR
jgi:hypothetical protein